MALSKRNKIETQASFLSSTKNGRKVKKCVCVCIYTLDWLECVLFSATNRSLVVLCFRFSIEQTLIIRLSFLFHIEVDAVSFDRVLSVNTFVERMEIAFEIQ